MQEKELTVDPWGPLDALCVALRRRAPLITATIDLPYGEEPPVAGEYGLGLRLHVSYRGGEIRGITWDGDAEIYRWVVGPDRASNLSADVEETVTLVARVLGAPVSPEPGN